MTGLTNSNGENLLMVVARSENVEIVNFLLKHRICDINDVDYDGRTAVFLYCLNRILISLTDEHET